MEASDDDTELWRRARSDDGAAFAALFDRHQPRVYRRALGLLANISDAEDVAAAAFFELWRRRHSVTLVGDSVVPWLLVTTVNLSRNVRRGTGRYRRLLHQLSPDDSTVAVAGDPEVRDRLASSLKQLNAVDGALFVLTVLEDVTITDAAQAVGLKPATARVRLHRARARLRDELHDLNPVQPAAEGSES